MQLSLSLSLSPNGVVQFSCPGKKSTKVCSTVHITRGKQAAAVNNKESRRPNLSLWGDREEQQHCSSSTVQGQDRSSSSSISSMQRQLIVQESSLSSESVIGSLADHVTNLQCLHWPRDRLVLLESTLPAAPETGKSDSTHRYVCQKRAGARTSRKKSRLYCVYIQRKEGTTVMV